MNITTKHCDVCEREIPKDMPGERLVLDEIGLFIGEDYQIFSTQYGDIEICCECCRRLSVMLGHLGISLDKSAMYYRAGFIYDKDLEAWTRKHLIIHDSTNTLEGK